MMLTAKYRYIPQIATNHSHGLLASNNSMPPLPDCLPTQ